MNAISLFGPGSVHGTWIEVLLGLSTLTMASALPDWQWQAGRAHVVSAWLPVGALVGLALASTMAGVMQPELFAAAFAI